MPDILFWNIALSPCPVPYSRHTLLDQRILFQFALPLSLPSARGHVPEARPPDEVAAVAVVVPIKTFRVSVVLSGSYTKQIHVIRSRPHTSTQHTRERDKSSDDINSNMRPEGNGAREREERSFWMLMAKTNKVSR